ncbi:MAG TPA: ABC transporter ATP-binding protein, partial [Caulobacteraceae bacterium]|nr:ABC transporter ATP-binding protein [Caulobacteraceae bacterium]
MAAGIGQITSTPTVQTPGGARPRATDGHDRTLWRLTGLIVGRRAGAAIALGCAAATAVFGLAPSPLIGAAVEVVVRHGPGVSPAPAWRTLAALAGALLAAQGLRGVCAAGYAYQAEAIGQSIASELRVRFFDKTQRLGREFYDHFHPADLVSRALSDIDAMANFIEVGLLRGVLIGVMFVFAGVQMLRMNALLAAIPVCFLMFASVTLWRLGDKLRPLAFQQQTRVGQLSKLVQESLSATRLIRVLDVVAHEEQKFDVLNDDVLKLSTTSTLKRSSTARLVQAVYLIALSGLLWAGGVAVGAGRLTLGELAAFITYLTILSGVVNQVPMMAHATARAAAGAARVFQVLDQPTPGGDLPERLPPGRFDCVRFDNVELAVRGQPDDPSSADGVSFSLRRGEILGVLGAPGSGKSTLAELISGDRRPTRGSIYFGDQDSRSIGADALKKVVFVVRQQAGLFTDTIAANIAYSRPEADFARIQSSAQQAQLHNDVMNLAKAYDTRVAERGASLSGGQRQRLSVARGLLDAP